MTHGGESSLRVKIDNLSIKKTPNYRNPGVRVNFCNTFKQVWWNYWKEELIEI